MTFAEDADFVNFEQSIAVLPLVIDLSYRFDGLCRYLGHAVSCSVGLKGRYLLKFQLAISWKNLCIAQDILENMKTTQYVFRGTWYKIQCLLISIGVYTN